MSLPAPCWDSAVRGLPLRGYTCHDRPGTWAGDPPEPVSAGAPRIGRVDGGRGAPARDGRSRISLGVGIGQGPGSFQAAAGSPGPNHGGPRGARRAVSRSGARVIALAFMGAVASCGRTEVAPTPLVASTPAPPPPTWIDAALADPARLRALAEGVDGSGVLALLDHRFVDAHQAFVAGSPALAASPWGLGAAERPWISPPPEVASLGPTARAGLVAVHLRLAAFRLHQGHFQEELARTHAEGRQSAAATLRHGPDETLVLTLGLRGLQAARSELGGSGGAVAGSVRAALAGFESSPFGRVHAAALAGAYGAEDPGPVDPQGSLGEAALGADGGVTFVLRAWSAEWPRTLARLHLLQARDLAGAAPSMAPYWAALAPAAWPQTPPTPPATEAPPLDPLLLALGDNVAGPEDLASWFGAGTAWANALEIDGARLDGRQDADSVDGVLRAARTLEDGARTAFSSTEDRAALSTDLDAPARLASWLMRRRAADLLLAADPAAWPQARRLAERALDPSSSRPDRLSPRNDPSSLIGLARTLWRAGDPAAALDIVQPLAEHDPALAAVVDYLTQLDAATTIGQHGKASQSP